MFKKKKPQIKVIMTKRPQTTRFYEGTTLPTATSETFFYPSFSTQTQGNTITVFLDVSDWEIGVDLEKAKSQARTNGYNDAIRKYNDLKNDLLGFLRGEKVIVDKERYEDLTDWDD
uniref:Uncharacterized protein n=1 Tax=viral metagenome TaxID=1070528 RepID=A0A6M3LRT6_9ZZZZ